MKRQEKCIHNKAPHTNMGVICDLRKPNTLCKKCKFYKSKYESYRCQKCGEYIGWLGRFIEYIYCGLIKHDCKTNKYMPKKLQNNLEDKTYLHRLLSSGIFPNAKIELGVFASEHPNNLIDSIYYGKITSIDLVDGYCHWEVNGEKKPCVNINCITLI